MELILLALAAAVYPTLLAGVILILSRPNPLRLLLAFLAGGMAISVVAGYAIVQALESSNIVSKSHSSNKPIVDIAVGAASLLVAWGVASGHITRGLHPRKQHRAPGRQDAQQLLDESHPVSRVADDGVHRWTRPQHARRLVPSVLSLKFVKCL